VVSTVEVGVLLEEIDDRKWAEWNDMSDELKA